MFSNFSQFFNMFIDVVLGEIMMMEIHVNFSNNLSNLE
jgi:hypothetical protein